MYYQQKKVHVSIHDVYKEAKRPKNSRKTQKKGNCYLPKTNQFTKSNIDKNPHQTLLTHSKKKYKKECLIAWSISFLQFSKALLFLSHQIIQNKHNRAVFQTFFPLLSYKGPVPTQKSTPNWRVPHPLHTKKSIN